MKTMNQVTADRIFNQLAYLESLLDWDSAMSVAHGTGNNNKTSNLLLEVILTKRNLYETEISEDCKAKFDSLSNTSMYYHFMVDVDKEESNEI